MKDKCGSYVFNSGHSVEKIRQNQLRLLQSYKSLEIIKGEERGSYVKGNR